MNDLRIAKYLRRGFLGLIAGLIGSVILVATLENIGLSIGLGIIIGIFYSLALRPVTGAYLDNSATGAAYGILFFILINVIGRPWLNGQTPLWTAGDLRQLFPALVGWIFYGAILGVLLQLFNDLAKRFLGWENNLSNPSEKTVTPLRILILGGGFAGITTAQHLEQEFGADNSVSFTLVSDTNALLFTPMLAEVAASSLEPTHISSPLRTSLRRTNVVLGKVIAIDLQGKSVSIAADKRSPERTLKYDHLVLALGAVSNFRGLDNVEKYAFDFKSLADAIQIRNHVIDMFERAEREINPVQRQSMLRFVIAGAGFAGAELAGGLNDFARGILAYYPNIPAEEIQIINIHSGERILPELSESMADYALKQMRQRGITFKLNTRVADFKSDLVTLNPYEEIVCRTLVWTAGTAPNPLMQTLLVERDQRGAVIVNEYLAVPGIPDLWAVGDCASVTDAKNGQPCPPTAQFALREAYRLASNIKAQVKGKPLKPFHFDSLGTLCVVGHHTACAEVKGFRFSGLLAWMMWRAIYLSKLPGLERKVRVFLDWNIELFFPRDIVQTIDFSEITNSSKTERS